MRDMALSLIGIAILLILNFVPLSFWKEAWSMWKEFRGK
jgi:hypothetical protein